MDTGSLYILGGWSGAQQLASMEKLDPREGRWMEDTPMPNVRNLISAVAIGSDIYAMGRIFGY